MASKRGVRRKMCSGKKRFETPKDAERSRYNVVRKEGFRYFMNIYRCPFCGGYHIGHSGRSRGG